MRLNIFRSMNFDCFFHVHINFGDYLFSTIPSFENPSQRSLYMRGVFLIFVQSNPREMLTTASSELQRDRQYTVFVFRVQMTPYYIQHRTKLFVFCKVYFFCSFCKHGLVRLNPIKTKNILTLKLSNFEKKWATGLIQHFYDVPGTKNLADVEFCRQQNFMITYTREYKCDRQLILAQLIIFATGRNFSLKPYQKEFYDLSKIPQIIPSYPSNEVSEYARPIFRDYLYPSVIYCFNLGKLTVADTNMWTKYVTMDTWGLLGLCLLLLCMLYTAAGSPKNSVKVSLRYVVLFVNLFLKLMRITVRQSWSHKWKLLGTLELLFSSLLSLYENSITVNVVVPLVPKPFSNTRDLYNHNYTFVVQIDNFGRVCDYLSDEYNTKSNRRVKSVKTFNILNEWLERYFLSNQNDTKYAIVGYFSKHFQFAAVNFVKEKNDTCYQMYPPEKEFYPTAFYFVFTSAMWSSLYKGLSLLQAVGFLRAYDVSKDFRLDLIAFHSTRRLVAQYDKDINYIDRKNNRLKENMITLDNMKSILFVGLIIIISSGVVFVAEVFSKVIVFMMLTQQAFNLFQFKDFSFRESRSLVEEEKRERNRVKIDR